MRPPEFLLAAVAVRRGELGTPLATASTAGVLTIRICDPCFRRGIGPGLLI